MLLVTTLQLKLSDPEQVLQLTHSMRSAEEAC